MKLFPGADSNLRFNPGETDTFEEYPDVDRPKKRGDCWDESTGTPIGPRPCPFVLCRHNAFMFVNRSGTAFADSGTTDPLSVRADRSCVLDMVEQDRSKKADEDKDPGMNGPEISDALGITRMGAEVAISSALVSAARVARKLGLRKKTENE